MTPAAFGDRHDVEYPCGCVVTYVADYAGSPNMVWVARYGTGNASDFCDTHRLPELPKEDYC